MKSGDSLKVILNDNEGHHQAYIPVGEKVKFTVLHNEKKVRVDGRHLIKDLMIL